MMEQGDHSIFAYIGETTSGVDHEYNVFDLNGSLLFSIESQYMYEVGDYFASLQSTGMALVDQRGFLMTDYIFDYLSLGEERTIEFSQNFFKKHGYLDRNGNILIEAQYDKVGTFHDGKAVVEKDGIYYLIDKVGHILVQYDADYVSLDISNGMTFAFEGAMGKGQFGEGFFYLMNLDGSYITPGYEHWASEYFYLSSPPTFSEKQQAWLMQNGPTWGSIESDGNVVFPFMECELLYFCGDDYIVEKDGLYALYGADGTAKTDFIFDDIERYSDDDLIYVHVADTK